LARVKIRIIFGAGLKEEKLIKKKQNYMKTETCKFYSRVF